MFQMPMKTAFILGNGSDTNICIRKKVVLYSTFFENLLFALSFLTCPGSETEFVHKPDSDIAI